MQKKAFVLRLFFILSIVLSSYCAFSKEDKEDFKSVSDEIDNLLALAEGKMEDIGKKVTQKDDGFTRFLSEVNEVMSNLILTDRNSRMKQRGQGVAHTEHFKVNRIKNYLNSTSDEQTVYNFALFLDEKDIILNMQNRGHNELSELKETMDRRIESAKSKDELSKDRNIMRKFTSKFDDYSDRFGECLGFSEDDLGKFKAAKKDIVDPSEEISIFVGLEKVKFSFDNKDEGVNFDPEEPTTIRSDDFIDMDLDADLKILSDATSGDEKLLQINSATLGVLKKYGVFGSKFELSDEETHLNKESSEKVKDYVSKIIENIYKNLDGKAAHLKKFLVLRNNLKRSLSCYVDKKDIEETRSNNKDGNDEKTAEGGGVVRNNEVSSV